MRFFFTLCLLFISLCVKAQDIPEVTIKNLAGDDISTSEFKNSKDIKVISFWATWCVPCINELDAISEIYQDWQDETNVEVIAISTDDARTRRRVKPLINGKDWEFKIYVDENQDLKRALNINILPYVIIVKDGKIIHTRTGYTPGSEEELFEIVKQHTD